MKPVTNYWTTYRRLWQNIYDGESKPEAYQAMAKSANSKVIFVPTSSTGFSGESFAQSSYKPGGEGSSKGEFESSYNNALSAHIASEL